jgi:hypothetical protein
LNLKKDIKYCLTPDQTTAIPVLQGDALVKSYTLSNPLRRPRMMFMKKSVARICSHHSVCFGGPCLGILGTQSGSTKMACFTLPSELFSFYKKHIDFIEEHAVDPDKRRYSDPEEAPRHYIDLDHYGSHPLELDAEILERKRSQNFPKTPSKPMALFPGISM